MNPIAIGFYSPNIDSLIFNSLDVIRFSDLRYICQMTEIPFLIFRLEEENEVQSILIYTFKKLAFQIVIRSIYYIAVYQIK
jgi:hypothetical protein